MRRFPFVLCFRFFTQRRAVSGGSTIRFLGTFIFATAICCSLGLDAAAFGGVVGVFQGRIVQPAGAKTEEGILYIRARNGMARKVRVEKAVIEYDEDVPKSQRTKAAASSLCADTLVRVTAEQSEQEDGAWKALNILILADPEGSSPKAKGRLKQVSFEPGQGEQVQGKGPSPKGKADGPRFCAP